MKRFKIYDIRTNQAVAWANNAEELKTALTKYPLSWNEAIDITNEHRVGVAEGKIYDRDAEEFINL